MKTKNLLERLSQLLSLEGSQRREELVSLRELLEKFELKEAKVSQRLADAQELGPDGEKLRQRLSDKLRVLRAQRMKGLERCAELEE
ncbi:MAG: hypothetical protein GY930_17545 [bacterium]|nr:hypothetical protein [bacterium]